MTNCLPLDKDKIASLIPHSGVMCLIDQVTSWDQQSICCHSMTHRQPDHPLRLDGELAALHLIEYGAQAMAIHAGLLAGTLKSGVLAAVRDVEFSIINLDAIKTALIIIARVEITTLTGSSYQFSITDNQDNLLLTARATVIIQSESSS